jgi:hypothetical protein
VGGLSADGGREGKVNTSPNALAVLLFIATVFLSPLLYDLAT